MTDPYTLEKRKADTLRFIKFMASLGMLDDIRAGHLASWGISR